MGEYVNGEWRGSHDGFWDTVGDGLSDAKNWLFSRSTAPSMPGNPYQQDWGNLIGQLQQQAAGNGPSLAANAYKQAHATGMNDIRSMSRAGTAGGTRQGGQMLGKMNQGFQQGFSNARLQEQLAARQMLTGALQGAGNAWFQPQYANLYAQLNTPTNFQMLTGFIKDVASGFGGAGAGGGGKA